MSKTLIVGGWYSTELSGYLISQRLPSPQKEKCHDLYNFDKIDSQSRTQQPLADLCTQHSPIEYQALKINFQTLVEPPLARDILIYFISHIFPKKTCVGYYSIYQSEIFLSHRGYLNKAREFNCVCFVFYGILLGTQLVGVDHCFAWQVTCPSRLVTSYLLVQAIAPHQEISVALV